MNSNVHALPPVLAPKATNFRVKRIDAMCQWANKTSIATAYNNKNNVITATLTRLTNKADTSGRITKALGDGP